MRTVSHVMHQLTKGRHSLLVILRDQLGLDALGLEELLQLFLRHALGVGDGDRQH